MKRADGGIRIIAGTFKGRRLACPEDGNIRPTSSLVRGALFNMLAGKLEGSEVLELYAGTGALGLEALSRGARHVVLVEGDRRTAEFLKRNLVMLGTGCDADLVNMDAVSYLEHCRSRFDLVLADPPYFEDLTQRLLGQIVEKNAIKDDGLVVIQEPSSRPPCHGAGPMKLWRTRQHGRHRLAFYRKAQEH
jgi:16S rRNA (guanine(966)-N(2))-methyltransferase RsmD